MLRRSCSSKLLYCIQANATHEDVHQGADALWHARMTHTIFQNCYHIMKFIKWFHPNDFQLQSDKMSRRCMQKCYPGRLFVCRCHEKCPMSGSLTRSSSISPCLKSSAKLLYLSQAGSVSVLNQNFFSNQWVADYRNLLIANQSKNLNLRSIYKYTTFWL